MRDDFSLKVKDTLSKRVGLRCSNPDCRVLTTGPNSLEDKATNIGVAAHITAAEQNGPRYVPSITRQERSSISNAIWLCQSCAKLIDNDTIKYTVEILRGWKTRAEEETELELTKKKSPTYTGELNELFDLMPSLINEIKTDIENNPLFREFILLKKGTVYNSRRKDYFVYYYDEHEDLDAKILLLENNELVKDITYNNTKRFVINERFVKILKSINKRLLE
jgi:hypothetical protein